MVLPGNKEYVEGDILPRSKEGRGKPSEPGEGDSEDAFRFVLSRDEFVDLLLDDLESPDLAKRGLASTERQSNHRAGYTNTGSPANLSVSRTVRLALSRRTALRRPRPELIRQLEAELADCDEEGRRVELTEQLEALRARLRRIPFIDPLDIRYRRFEAVPNPATQAVMFCLMDVSGSMSEHMKDLAKRFYMLLYVFLKRRYRHVESSSSVIRSGRRGGRRHVLRRTGIGWNFGLKCLEQDARHRSARFRPSDWNMLRLKFPTANTSPD